MQFMCNIRLLEGMVKCQSPSSSFGRTSWFAWNPGGGGGGHFHWRPYQMLEKKNAEKGYPNQGWARNAWITKRVSKSRKIGKMGIQITIDQSSSRGIICGKGRQFKTTCVLIFTSNQHKKTSELFSKICVKAQKMLALVKHLAQFWKPNLEY